MSVILLSILPAAIELDPSFAIWERSFHARPCETILYGIVCGHEASYRAHAKCVGCGKAVEEIFICPEHMRAYNNGCLVFHARPCGALGFGVKLTNIEPV